MSVHNYVCIYACMTVLIMTGCKPINYVSYTQQASHPSTYTLTFQNHKIERFWVEINKRVNYPLKIVLVEMENNHSIRTQDQSDSTHCFCVSWITLRVATVGTTLAVQAWNEHPIPGELSAGNVIKHKHSIHIHVQCFIQYHASM